MTLTVGTSGGNKTVTALTVGTASGNKAVTYGYVGTAGGNKEFYSSASAAVVDISDNTASDFRPGELSSAAAVTFSGDGFVSGDGNFASFALAWRTPTGSGVGVGYDIRATSISGDAPNTGASLSTWLNLGTARSWGQQVIGSSLARSGTIRVEIRDASTLSVLDTADYAISASTFL